MQALQESQHYSAQQQLPKQASAGLHVQPVHHTCQKLKQSSCRDAGIAREQAHFHNAAVSRASIHRTACASLAAYVLEARAIFMY